MSLADKKCVPCEGGTPPIGEAEAQKLIAEAPGWVLKEGHVWREFKFRNFRDAMAFVNKVAGVAEEEGHHPDMQIRYNRVSLELWTHAINGLSENDFILAAKINKLL